jgi:predicted glycosyltransferase involved in capsule biosynthesis
LRNLANILSGWTSRNLALLFFAMLSVSAKSQNWAFELWHDGKIVLNEGDTLKGLVKYDMQQDLVQFSLNEKKAEVYTARKVLYFEIFDNTIHKYRRFFTLPFSVNAGYRTQIFFELLEEGKMTLLSRELLEYKTYSSPYYIGSYSRLVLTNRYFFLKDDGTIEEFLGNKNDLLALMGRQSEEVEKYIKSNNLRFDDKSDIAQIVAYYNSLVKS